MSKFNINLHEAIFSLSHALDLVGVDEIHHGKRVAFMAVEFAKALGWESLQLDNLFQAAILHDCGVSQTQVHEKLVQFEWKNEMEHCKIGAALLNKTPPLAYLADYIYYHHTHWAQLKSLDLPDEIKLTANCIYMADRIDVLAVTCLSQNDNILSHVDGIRERIAYKSGVFFAPELVDAFLKVSSTQAFWFSLEGANLSGYMNTWIAHDSTKEIQFEDVKALAQIFSHIVDAKSRFTKEHSEGVASLSRYLGELFCLTEHSCDKLELAGLLHDLGKLRVPDYLLEKNDHLTKEEYLIIQRHSFDTYEILKNINGFEDVAQWAAQHHERVDGSGYPYHDTKRSLSFEARVIAVADVFQALAQNRPYRKALNPNEILLILKEEASDGKLDKNIVAMVEKNISVCWKTALLLH